MRHALEESVAPLAWSAFLLAVAAILVTGDILWIVVFNFTGYSYRSALMGMIPAPLVLLSTGIFYLWFYLRRDRASASAAVAADLRPVTRET